MRCEPIVIGRLMVAVIMGLFLPLILSTHALAHSTDDRAGIAKVMMATWDRPEERLSVEPVVVVGDYALAGWTQGDRGGRALLKRNHGAWAVHVCGGDALMDPAMLVKIGVAKKEADKLVVDARGAEKKLAPKKVAMFSLFDGLLEMDSHGNHPPAAGHEPSQHGHSK